MNQKGDNTACACASGQSCSGPVRLTHGASAVHTAGLQSELLDQFVVSVLTEQLATLDPGLRERMQSQAALVAVGGSGRGEMCPYSDVDLLFLATPRMFPLYEPFAAQVQRDLWDAGLKVGASARTVADSIRWAKQEPQFATSLVDARELWGASSLVEQLQSRFSHGVVRSRMKQFIADAVGLVDNPGNYHIIAAVPPKTDQFICACGSHRIAGVCTGRLKRQINIGEAAYDAHDQGYAEYYTVMMHELGHCFGLSDLYGTPHRVGPWDVMGDILYADGYLGWHRNLFDHRNIFGWLFADRKTCIKAGVWEDTIGPLSAPYGMAMVVVPDSAAMTPSTMYVIEVASKVTDHRSGTVLSEEGAGVLVYKVTSLVPQGRRPLEIIPNPHAEHSSVELLNAPFKVGDTFDQKDLPFKLAVERKIGTGFHIRIEVRNI